MTWQPNHRVKQQPVLTAPSPFIDSPTLLQVVGGTGQTGKELISLLCALPSTVVSSIRVLVRTTPTTSPFPSDPRIVLVPGSLASGSALPSLSGVSVVVHTASGKDYSSCLDVDCLSVSRLASAAELAGVRRFVLVSSQLVHPSNRRMPIRGFLNSVVTGVWARYGLMDMKFVGEEFLRRAAATGTTLSYTIVRPGRLLDDKPSASSGGESGGPHSYSASNWLVAQNNVNLRGDLGGVYRRDLAALCVAAALVGEAAADVTLEIGANKPEEGKGKDGTYYDNTDEAIAKWLAETGGDLFKGLSKDFDKGWGEDLKEFKEECIEAISLSSLQVCDVE